MLSQQLASYRFMRSMLEGYCADLSPEDVGDRHGFLNPPGWIVGHLAVVFDMLAKTLGGEAKCPNSWHALFGRGSDIDRAVAEMPPLAELVAVHKERADAVEALLEAADEADFAGPHDFDLFKGRGMDSVADLVGHVLTSHYAFHTGQFSMWRRAKGHAPLF